MCLSSPRAVASMLGCAANSPKRVKDLQKAGGFMGGGANVPLDVLEAEITCLQLSVWQALLDRSAAVLV
jgi:hypothetical protein